MSTLSATQLLRFPLILLALTSCQVPDRAAQAQSGTADDPAVEQVVEARRIWSGTEVDDATGDISPDGKYLSDINWNNGDFQLRDLETGEDRDVTGTGYDEGRYAWTSDFSNDGKQIAVSWYVYEAGAHELRLMKTGEAESRLLVPAREEYPSIDPVGWSPSDEEILVSLGRSDRVWELGLVSVDGGSLEVLKTGSQVAGPGNAGFAPEGDWLAYDYPPDLDEPRSRDIYALRRDGSGERVLVSGPANDRLLGWIPDGSGILFYSDRSGTPGIWRLSVEDGEAVGDPRLVHADVWGLVGLGFTDRGYAYSVQVESHQVHMGVVDLEAGRLVVPARPVDEVPSRQSLTMDWSPDGSRIAYVASGPHDPVETLVIRTTGGAVAREMPLPYNVHTSNGTLAWINDETILVFGVDPERGRGIFRVDLRDGSFEWLPGFARVGAGIKWFEMGPEGRTMYALRNRVEQDGVAEFVARDGESDALRVVGTTRGDNRAWDVSADGSQFAYADEVGSGASSVLRVLPTSGSGEPRTLYRASENIVSWPVAWTPDGSRIVFRLAAGDWEASLWSMPTDGRGEPVPLEGMPCCLGRDLRFHPDGRRFAVTAGMSRAEVWVLTGY